MDIRRFIHKIAQMKNTEGTKNKQQRGLNLKNSNVNDDIHIFAKYIQTIFTIWGVEKFEGKHSCSYIKY